MDEASEDCMKLAKSRQSPESASSKESLSSSRHKHKKASSKRRDNHSSDRHKHKRNKRGSSHDKSEEEKQDKDNRKKIGFLRPDCEYDSRYRRQPSDFDENGKRRRSDKWDSNMGYRNAGVGPPWMTAKETSPSREVSPPKPDPEPVQENLTFDSLNVLGARLVKAELMGNEELVAKLKKQLELARSQPLQAASAVGSTEEEEEKVILTSTNARGFVHPLQDGGFEEPAGRRRRRRTKGATHEDGKRVRYFLDDDKYSLQEMFEKEKVTTAEDENAVFSKMAGKCLGSRGDDMDDIFTDNARIEESGGKVQAQEKEKAIQQHKKMDKALDNCCWCYSSNLMLKHLLVEAGEKVYVCLPPNKSLTPGHCLIVPMFHVKCVTLADEEVWNEIQSFRKRIVKMFKEMDQDVVFFEVAMNLSKYPHMVLECVPLPRASSEEAPMFFKKAILECEKEWATNKQLVPLGSKGVRRSVPQGLPYMWVEFDFEDGFAHVIEDERRFPKLFCYEILGGLLDLDHSYWRRNKETLEEQCKKVVDFQKWWNKE